MKKALLASKLGVGFWLLVLVSGLVPACSDGTAGEDGAGAPGVTGGSSNDGTGGAAPEGGMGGDGGLGGVGGMGGQGTGGTVDPCDQTEEGCTEEVIVHVSPDGDDDGAGTREAPVETVAKALELVALAVEAGATAPSVYLCATEGAYMETLTIGPEHGAVSIQGGFDCESFEASEERALLHAENSRGHRIEGASGVKLSDMILRSPNAKGAGTSSYGLWVVESTDVRIQRSEVIAGKGAAGADGVGYESTDTAEAGAEGNPGTDACVVTGGAINVGGEPVTTSCGGEPTESIGGEGGPGGVSTFPGGDGVEGEPDGGTLGAGENADACTNGGNGSPGVAGEHGTASQALGPLSDAGLYVPLSGGNGTAGTVGEGGGGGGGAAKPASCETGASGGSGGGGGCPGVGAGGGNGGGGSFGIMSMAAEVELSDVSISVAVGGTGGAGGDGQLGGNRGAGAAGGTPVASGGTDACSGGNGGRGGNGGSGAGGAGGPSIAVVHTGDAPSGLDNLSLTLPEAGAAGGPGGSLNEAGQGPVGIVQAAWAP